MCGVFLETQRGVQSLEMQLSAVTYLLSQLAKAVTQQASLNWIIFWLFSFSSRQLSHHTPMHQIHWGNFTL